jgi:hypothetical protein
MAMVRDFERGDINIAMINYATIILIPKEDEARTLKIFATDSSPLARLHL